MNFYYQKREATKTQVSCVIREYLMGKYRGKPVHILRRDAKEIRQKNKEIVRDILRQLDCEDFAVKWSIFFDYRHDDNQQAIVRDIFVMAEGA